MRFSVLRNMLLKSQDLYNYPILEPRRSDRGGYRKNYSVIFSIRFKKVVIGQSQNMDFCVFQKFPAHMRKRTCCVMLLKMKHFSQANIFEDL